MTFFDAMEKRRSIYALGKQAGVSKERIKEIVAFAVKNTPSAFNSQTGRVVVLFEKESSKFWSIARETLRKIVPADAFKATEEKLASFDAGYGTILFFEDQSIVEALMAKFPTYKDNFPIWSLQSNGMLEFSIWTALAEEGVGASLQHYNPLVDTEVKKNWGLPDNWKLLAEMPFGSVAAPAGPKEFAPLDGRIQVFG